MCRGCISANCYFRHGIRRLTPAVPDFFRLSDVSGIRKSKKNDEKNDFPDVFFRKIAIVMRKCPVSGPDSNHSSKQERKEKNEEKTLTADCGGRSGGSVCRVLHRPVCRNQGTQRTGHYRLRLLVERAQSVFHAQENNIRKPFCKPNIQAWFTMFLVSLTTDIPGESYI